VITTQAIIPPWVGAYIGIPFKERGRDASGLDCYGLLFHVYRNQYKISLPMYAERYSLQDRLSVAKVFFEETTSARWRRVLREEAEPPDVLTMTLSFGSHVGILVTPDRFLHVLPGRETCVERLQGVWERRIEGIYRHGANV